MPDPTTRPGGRAPSSQADGVPAPPSALPAVPHRLADPGRGIPAAPPRNRNVLVAPAAAAQDDTPRRPASRTGLAALRTVAVMGWTVGSCCLQAALVLLPGRPKVAFARLYWAGICRLLGLSVRLLGEPPPRPGNGRPVVFVSNHSSWLDIAVLGGRIEACFVSKDDVRGWPLVGTVARLGRTVFVSRRRSGTGRERDAMQARLLAGDNLLLFPEGTSSDGSRVLPFHSSFFAVADLSLSAPAGGPPSAAAGGPPSTAAGGSSPTGADVAPRPLIQPVSLAYDRLGGLPAGRTSRAVFAWYGDMELPPHFWRLAQCRGMRATVVLHPPLDPADFASRKELALAAWTVVANGAAAVRQNRAA